MKEAPTKLLIENVPEKLKADFKAACAKRKVTMKEAILQFMQSFIHGKR